MRSDRTGPRGFGLIEREDELAAAEEALNLLTGLGDDDAWPARPDPAERVPLPREDTEQAAPEGTGCAC